MLPLSLGVYTRRMEELHTHETNYAFIDGQNLYMQTSKRRNDDVWRIDYGRFRKYLLEKYNVTKAYYFFGYYIPSQAPLYRSLRGAGFELCFKEHSLHMLGSKKGNVDTDIVFDVMYHIYRKESFDRVVMVSGDGDYRKLIDFLIKEDRFKKLLIPNSATSSSLYKKIGTRFYDHLDNPDVRKKIERFPRNEKGSLGN